MKTLIVGAGALGGLIAARLSAAGGEVSLATRDRESAEKLGISGLRVEGIGGEVSTKIARVAPLDAYDRRDGFALVVLATKARDAIDVAPKLASILSNDGTLLPIQNGGVAQLLAGRLGERVLGGLSNLGATMKTLGAYEQRNAGHLLVGELSGGVSERTNAIRDELGRGVQVRTTTNLAGAVWSKLIVNCSVTTIGAIAGRTMRAYLELPGARELFDRTYDEAHAVAVASGARPEKMLVDPARPKHDDGGAWLDGVLKAYGDLEPSMLQDFRRGRPTEVDFINGYVTSLGRTLGVPTPANAAITETVHAITRGELAPHPTRIERILRDFPR